MASVDVNDILRVTARMSLGRGQDMENVFYVRNEGLGGATDSQAIGDVTDWLDDLYSNVSGAMGTGVTFVDILFHNVTQNRPMVSGTWPTLTTGGTSSAGLPAGAAALIGLNTGVLKVHGRKYLGGFTEADNDGDAVSASLTTALVSFGGQLLLSFLGASAHAWLPGVIDKDGAFWAFGEAVVSGIWAYQRRRRFGTGN